MMIRLEKLPLYLAISMITAALASPAFAQDSEKDKKEEEQDIEELVVTGSLIPRTSNTGISAVTIIDSVEMAERGMTSLGDVMKSFTENSGYTEGTASNLLGRFTTGAQEVNFRGLGTGRTLVLINGRRIADYPLPFGGEQNGVDFASIPFAAVAQVEYLSSGASAIYGSDAVGGVINVITKRDMEQTIAEVTTGMFADGFGETVNASFVTGKAFDRGSVTVGLSANRAEPILASDSKYLQKNAPYNASVVSLLQNTLTGSSEAVPSSACAPLGFDYADGTCMSDLSDTISLSPEYKQASTFFDGRYDLTDNIELFLNGMATVNRYETRSNVMYWEGIVADEMGENATFITRAFSSNELGSADVFDSQNMWTTTFGAKGGLQLGDHAWHWDLAFSHAQYETENSTINLKEEGIRNWILDGAASITDFAGQQSTYFVDDAFYQNNLIGNVLRPVQGGDIDDLIGEKLTKAKSSSDSLTLTVSGTLGDLGVLAEPVKFAVLSEFATQSTEIIPDERTLNTAGEGWYGIGGIASKGTRDRAALAAELEIPVHPDLDISLAGRFDNYNDASSIAGRASGQTKFLYRANDWLKLRGGYSQTFRAPDMFNIYGRSDGFQGVADVSRPGCYDGVNYYCGYSTVAITREADAGLSEEHGHDFGFGLIFMPTTNFTLTADWYKIQLDDLVNSEFAQDLLLQEWQCASGTLSGSELRCADLSNRIQRNSFGAVERIVIRPINQASLEREGIDLRADYTYASEKLGEFRLDMSHSHVMNFTRTMFEGDAPLDITYGELGASTPANVSNASLTWRNPLTEGQEISASLSVQRLGRVYNYTQTQFMEPMYNTNLTVGYQMNAYTVLRMSVNNLLDTEPDLNDSGFWPGYWAHLQNGNALGRSASLTINYRFN